MRLLIDSHVALWWLDESDQLGPIAHGELLDASEVFFSPVTSWELGIKRSAGKIMFPDGFVDELLDSGIFELPVTAAHATVAANLPFLHRDPFDRMLVAQAQVEDLMLVTADRAVMDYEVETLDARE